jgi:hypothetical protein
MATESRVTPRIDSLTVLGASVTGARLVGPIAIAALAGAAGAVGALAIGRLVIADAVIRRLRAGTVEIQALRVEDLEINGKPWLPGPGKESV